MRSDDVVVRGVFAEVLEPALQGGLSGLLFAPCGDAGVRMSAQVVGSRRAFRLAQLPVCGPRLVVDADYAAGGSLRRHAASVADRAVTGHQPVTECLPIDLLVTSHPGVLFKGATAASQRSNRPP